MLAGYPLRRYRGQVKSSSYTLVCLALSLGLGGCGDGFSVGDPDAASQDAASQDAGTLDTTADGSGRDVGVADAPPCVRIVVA